MTKQSPARYHSGSSLTVVFSSSLDGTLKNGRFMIAVIQRVERCSVSVDNTTVSSIGRGFLILLGVHKDDSDSDIELLARKCSGLRIFTDSDGKMNLSLKDVEGDVIVVSQFTLFGDVRRGLRPYFGDAAPPDKGNACYEKFMRLLADGGLSVQGGVFGAHMNIDLLNDGPVTIILDTRNMQ